jgi:hypothetical protein
LANASENIPTDRIIDGLDQSALFLNGDTHGRRDYAFIYEGSRLRVQIRSSIPTSSIFTEIRGKIARANLLNTVLGPAVSLPT